MSSFSPDRLASISVIARLLGADMNSTDDQPFVWIRRPRKWRLNLVFFTNASISLTTAVGGIYTAASKGGTALLAANQAYSLLTSSTVVTAAATAQSTLFTDATDAILSLSTPQGAAATADFYLYANVLEW